MRSSILTVILVLALFNVDAGDPEKIETLTAKAPLNTQGFYVLSDGSCWKVFPFVKRTRSLTEWWNNEQLIPNNYEVVPDDWLIGTKIEIYPKQENLNVNEADAYNQNDLGQCTHLFVNAGNQQILFGVLLSTEDCVVQAFKEGYEAGYKKGRSRGFAAGWASHP